jgi:hypothetical protein
MRSHCVKSQSMKRSSENVNENNSNLQRALSKNDAIAQQISKNWRLNDDLLCFKNAWYVFANFMRRLLLKQNYDDSHAKHFDVKKTLELLKRKYYWSQWIRTWRSTWTHVFRVIKLRQSDINLLNNCKIFSCSRNLV